MPRKAPRSPRQTIKVDRLPGIGETILLPVTVERVDEHEHRSDTITVAIPGGPARVTLTWPLARSIHEQLTGDDD